MLFLNYYQYITQKEILLVDDTPEHIEFIVSILSQNDFKIRVATKGKTALKLLKQHIPDLILLDVYMPIMNGFQVCKLIKSNEAFSDIPIIFLTASNDEKSIEKGFELGAQDYVVKPFNSKELLARINTHIKIKQQTETIKEAYKELDSFCYSVSHDLKAPLFSINKLIEFIFLDHSKSLNSDCIELLGSIKEKSDEVIKMITRLLEFSRMCKLEMKMKDINLKQMFLGVYTELISLEPERDVNFNIEELPVIKGDIIMIRLLVLNILSNALKYTGKKAHAIIEVTLKETKNDYIISVKDNGVGFDTKYSSRLFGVFERLHSENEFKGTGVGLAITQRILKRHKGKAWITGKVGKGAVYSFSLPK
ncbi:response regulator [Clostridium tyrobutyricum]|uniref:response regulator n=1 Tax=Clostridium tyrobutyricum TaxID=1519 RepID=UPI001FA764D4|nr:response regulator [Clostridium tyrobutyricum]